MTIIPKIPLLLPKFNLIIMLTSKESKCIIVTHLQVKGINMTVAITLRLEDDAHETMVNLCCEPEGRSMNKMLNILVAEALNARLKNQGFGEVINTMTGKYEE